MNSRKVAVIGCGAIGEILAKSIDRGEAGKNELSYLFDLEMEKAESLAKELSKQPIVASEISEILNDEEVDLVVEAASQKAVIEYSSSILKSEKDLIVLSIGAFANKELYDKVSKEAEEMGQRVYLPSGAILGVDGLKSVSMADINEARLVTQKPPETLSTTKFVQEESIDLSDLEEPKVVFEGTAQKAVEAFPESVNVAATLSLSTVGFERTQVKIIADPSINRNIHEIHVKGDAGKFMAESRNVPSPDNPKTSYLAALSAVRTLKNLTEAVSIGT
ncbi:MAG: aspartate dehydrogenase [Hadesarchaea archaeon]|nr:aspartate dehydrogenase [Hadesarchaea archaeon]